MSLLLSNHGRIDDLSTETSVTSFLLQAFNTSTHVSMAVYCMQKEARSSVLKLSH